MKRVIAGMSVFASVALIAVVCVGQSDSGGKPAAAAPKDDTVRSLVAHVDKLTRQVQDQNRIVTKLQAKVETQQNDLKALRQVVVRQAVVRAQQPPTSTVPGQLPSGIYDYRDLNLQRYFILCKDQSSAHAATLAPTQLRTIAPARR